MADKVRVGVVGTSWYCDVMHLPNLKGHARADVVALCGRNQARLDEVADRYGIPRRFTDWRNMIGTAKLDAVVVAAPDDLHYPITMEALEAGLHVLCEKPLAMSAAQAEGMLAKARSTGRVTMTYFTWRWVPLYRHLLQLVRDGYLGRLLRFEARYLGGYTRGEDYSWRADPRHSLGVLGDMGSHMIDLALQIGGPIARVSACLGSLVPKNDAQGTPMDRTANDSAFCLLQFAGGAQGMVEVTSTAHVAERSQEQHLVLHGEKGTLETDLVSSTGMKARGARSSEPEFKDLPIPAETLGGVDPNRSVYETVAPYFRSQPVGTRAFIDAIVQKGAVSPSFEDGYRVQQVIEAAFNSHAKGCWTTVE